MTFAGMKILPGEKKKVEIPVSRLPTQTWVSIPVQIINGIKPGPCLALISGVHGDEINGMEVMRTLQSSILPENVSGRIIMVPVVNVFGFLNNSRYLPDRRDLNRSFPGNAKGSMAARLAHIFSEEILKKADFAIDFHTAALGRMNHPHIRANMRQTKVAQLAHMFGPGLILHAAGVEGSLRKEASKYRCKTILFEGGGVNQFNNEVIQKALQGTWRVLGHLGILKPPKGLIKYSESKLSRSSAWVRAHRSGIFRLFKDLGDEVVQKEIIGVVSNIFGETLSKVRASHNGIIIGMQTDPKVHKGEAIVHLAKK